MDIIHGLLKILVVFAGTNASRSDISVILAVLTRVANILMDEIDVRDRRTEAGRAVDKVPFHPGHLDQLSSVVEEVELKRAPSPRTSKTRVKKPRFDS